jgi:hypothetical protein
LARLRAGISGSDLDGNMSFALNRNTYKEVNIEESRSLLLKTGFPGLDFQGLEKAMASHNCQHH